MRLKFLTCAYILSCSLQIEYRDRGLTRFLTAFDRNSGNNFCVKILWMSGKRQRT